MCFSFLDKNEVNILQWVQTINSGHYNHLSQGIAQTLSWIRYSKKSEWTKLLCVDVACVLKQKLKFACLFVKLRKSSVQRPELQNSVEQGDWFALV